MRLRHLTAGESHGRALVGILEGMPAGLSLRAADIQQDLARRRLGWGRSARQDLESDRVEILSGVRRGRTIGAPISLLVPNADFRPEAGPAATIPRPGHADWAGARKYGCVDLNDIAERASARETCVRTALGAVARRFLDACGVRVAGRVLSIGTARAPRPMAAAVARAMRRGDTLGGTFEVRAEGLPAGLGSCAHWDQRLDGRLAAALMALNGVKGVAVGLGFAAAALPGSRVHDALAWRKGRVVYRSNRCGGLEGGMTTGEPLVLSAAMKPLPTMARPLPSVDLATGRPAPAPCPRSDVCAVPAAAVIAEALIALVLADALLEKTGGDSMKEILPRLRRLRP